MLPGNPTIDFRTTCRRLQARSLQERAPLEWYTLVANVPRPDGGSWPLTCHNGCTRGCAGIREGWGCYTEVDLLGRDTVTGKTVILELKTMSVSSMNKSIRTRPGSSHVTVLNCFRPTVTKTLVSQFRWLRCFCEQVFACLTPNCVNSRVEIRPKVDNSQGEQAAGPYNSYASNCAAGPTRESGVRPGPEPGLGLALATVGPESSRVTCARRFAATAFLLLSYILTWLVGDWGRLTVWTVSVFLWMNVSSALDTMVSWFGYS
ncbi:hypothetical protein AAFF_G00171660 [Aldrovandia affinis]|uniref:Uncharacterized protein n=1 Tax=Aldrovandia affinis TaxID=143900 RepID=A0AAD7SYT8_9TELE|nr:hypothetical protein AAFF_G00171660 [Aldrovandia affinis]